MMLSAVGRVFRHAGSSYRPRHAGQPASPVDGDPDDVLAAAARDNAHFDYLQILLRNKRTERSAHGFGALLRDALVTVWAAARWPFAWVLVLTVVTSVVAVAQVLATKQLLDDVLADTGDIRLAPLLAPVLLLGGLTAVSFGVTAAMTQIQRLLGELVMRDTHRRMLDVTTTVPLDAYETPWFFNYVVRIETNALSKPLELVQAVIALITGVAVTAGLGAVLLSVEPLLLPLLLITALPSYLVNRRGSRLEFAFAVEQSAGLRERMYLANVLKTRDTAKEIRAFDLASLLRARWERRYSEHTTGLNRLVGKRLRLSLGGAVASGALLVATMVFLLWRVDTGHVELSAAGAALVGMRMIATRLQAMAGGSTKLYESKLFLGDLRDFLRLGEVMAAEPAPTTRAVANGQTPRLVPRHGFDRLVVDHVAYTYPGGDRPALQDVTLEIERGEIVALVGENGSGKTTLAKLLAGLHRPSTGAVCWDGVPLGDLDPAQLHRRIAVIFQDFARYELSALENIAVGRAHDDFDVTAVRRAAEHAGAASFVEALPFGYDTMLSKAMAGGADLSLGQWQRIALARAIYRDAAFVLLDEPTSALDPRAESELFARMRTMFAGRTVLLISHRFSSVRHADRIHVLDGGRIVEQGAHEELISHGGLYAELFTLQAAAFLDR